MDDLPGTLWGIISIWISGGVWSQGWNLKGLTEGHHQEWNLRLNLTQHGKTYQVRTQWGLTDWELFLDFVGGGAWPFLVGGVICLVNSVSERDLNLLNSCANPGSLTILSFGGAWYHLFAFHLRVGGRGMIGPEMSWWFGFIEGLLASLARGGLRQKQVCDALRCSGLHARYTAACKEFKIPVLMRLGNLFKVRRDGDRALKLLLLNEEFLVIAGHQPAMITSLPFVHTARRSYRWLNRWGLGMILLDRSVERSIDY